MFFFNPKPNLHLNTFVVVETSSTVIPDLASFKPERVYAIRVTKTKAIIEPCIPHNAIIINLVQYGIGFQNVCNCEMISNPNARHPSLKRQT